jgi:hypothetical protein
MKKTFSGHHILLSCIILSLFVKKCWGQEMTSSHPPGLIPVKSHESVKRFQSLSSDTLEDKIVDIKKPVIYIATFMAVDLLFMIVTGIADNKPSTRNFRRAFREGPAPDNDHWFTNYVLHPLMGSESYLRAREGNWGWFGSFLFSTAASIIWEFIYESWTERPSTQDLFITSTTGSLLGEIRYQLKQNMDKKHHWLVDPIDTFFISLKKENGKTQAMVGLAWHFGGRNP